LALSTKDVFAAEEGEPTRALKAGKNKKKARALKADKSKKSTRTLKSNKVNKASKGAKKAKKGAMQVPEVNDLMNIAFPMWEVDEDGVRIGPDTPDCTPTTCEWNPYYLTKRYDGLHPDMGGHPTDLDVGYAFYGASPFNGQAFQGSPHHCSKAMYSGADAVNANPPDCPKLETLDDKGPYGPGHVPPHISLASLTWGVEQGIVYRSDLFDYDLYQCRVVPDVLLHLIRHYFPRTDGEKVDYPPPITVEGGDYKYEFPSGNGVDNQEPPYAPGPPHWCEDDFLAGGHWPDFCPYIFEGPDAGKYRHPHIAYAAVEVYLANMVMPDKCGPTWLENNPEFLGDDWVATNIEFPTMDSDAMTVAGWASQPSMPYAYAGPEPRAAKGVYALEFAL